MWWLEGILVLFLCLVRSIIKKSRNSLHEESRLRVWSWRTLQKAQLCCCRKEPVKCHCQREHSSQSTALTLPLERETRERRTQFFVCIKTCTVFLLMLQNCSFAATCSVSHWTPALHKLQLHKGRWHLVTFKHQSLKEKGSLNQSKSVWKAWRPN